MSNLKTLKDLWICEGCKKLIRAEAVKWVKENVEKDGFTHWRDFMNFHDITEENLK